MEGTLDEAEALGVVEAKGLTAAVGAPAVDLASPPLTIEAVGVATVEVLVGSLVVLEAGTLVGGTMGQKGTRGWQATGHWMWYCRDFCTTRAGARRCGRSRIPPGQSHGPRRLRPKLVLAAQQPNRVKQNASNCLSLRYSRVPGSILSSWTEAYTCELLVVFTNERVKLSPGWIWPRVMLRK